MRYLSFHDFLTGLYNRDFFEEELNKLDTTKQLPLSIIMSDVKGLIIDLTVRLYLKKKQLWNLKDVQVHSLTQVFVNHL